VTDQTGPAIRRRSAVVRSSSSPARMFTRSPVKNTASGRCAFTLSASRVSSRSGRTRVPTCMSVICTNRKPSKASGMRSEQISTRLTRMEVRPRVVPQRANSTNAQAAT